MSDANFKTQIQRVSEWIAALRYEDIPAEITGLVKWQLLDAMAAMCAGSRSTAGERLQVALDRLGEGGNCTVIPTGKKWNWENAVYYHAAMINALELDHFTFMGHIGQSSISAALTLGEMTEASGREFLTALIAAQEVGGRMGGYLATGPQQGHMRAFIHRAVGAVAACKLHGCDAKTTAQAMAIALSAPEFPLYPAGFSPDTKVTCTSAPAVEGIRSAFLAMSGLDAPLDIIEHPLGFVAFFSYLPEPPGIWGRIGESWTPYTLSFKKFAACAYAQGPVDAALQIKEALADFDPDAIEKITVFGPIVSVVMEKFSRPHLGAQLTPVNTHFSNRRSVAASLLFGEPTGEFYRKDHFEKKTPAIHDLAEKIELRHDWQLTLDMIKAVDGGIRNPGRPGVFSLGASGAAMDRFRKAFGSRPLIQWSDIPDLYRMSKDDRGYLFRRFWKSYRGKFPFLSRQEKQAWRSTEGDLKNMRFAIGGRVKVMLKNGKKLEATCSIPSGFAGDENRLAVAEAKYFRETTPVWGQEKAEKVKQVVHKLPNVTVRELMAACAEKF